MSKEKENKKKDIEIISGNGSNLNISPVYEHISSLKPKGKDSKNNQIVIPKISNKKKKN